MMRDLENQLRREQGLVHLQYVGEMPGTPAGDLAVGDRLMWNGGAIYTVTAIREASPKFIEITERADAGSNAGKEYQRRLKKSRLVVRARPGEKFHRATTVASVTGEWLRGQT
jgi:hypothetical protein